MNKKTIPVLLFFLISFFLSFKQVSAQLPEPYIKCSDEKDNEWHSLRPYQASPCTIPINMNEQAKICGNDYQIKDVVIAPDDGPPKSCNGPSTCPGTAMCYFEIPRKFQIFINAYDSEYPIAGNTELVPGGTGTTGNVLQRLEDYQGKLPPDINEENMQDYTEYYKAVRRWRGDSCASVKLPIIGKEIVLCFDNPLKPNFYSELFPEIPYSSTEDRVGKIHSSDIIWDPDRSSYEPVPNPPNTEWNPSTPTYGPDPNIGINEAALYFPHMEENIELSTLLQSSYLPKELLEKEQKITTAEEPEEPNRECKLVEVRYNPGDQLFGTQRYPNAEVSYRAKFNCECRFDANCNIIDCCTRSATFHTDIDTYTPMIEELFSKTVSGNASIFKKIFPKIEEGAPVAKIEDIPAVSDVQHDKKDIRSRTTLISTDPEIYFPHLGSIYDYFIKKVQTALRPKEMPNEPLGLNKSTQITSPNTLNEYVSWYLNGSEYRAENDPLANSDPKDIYKVINFTGPINKLLSQHSQWRNAINIVSPSYKANEIGLGKVDQVAKSGSTRHNQIAACVVFAIRIPIIGAVIGGIPAACQTESQNNLPGGGATPGPGGTTPPGTSDSCPNIPDSSIPQTYRNLKENFIRLADQWAGAECNLAEECYNYVVNQSVNQGVNPAMSLSIWLHESGASNYCHTPGVEDFGVHYIPGQNLTGQLSEWLAIAKGTGWLTCYLQGGWIEKMHTFLSRYQLGSAICDPTNELGNSFYEEMKTVFSWVTEPVASCLDGSGGFAIDTPTDNSCP